MNCVTFWSSLSSFIWIQTSLLNQTLKISAIITSVILLSGTLGFVLSNPDAFASGQGQGKDKGKGEVPHDFEGCPIAKEASEDKTQNPHCTDCEQKCVDAAEELSKCLTANPMSCENFEQVKAEIEACVVAECTTWYTINNSLFFFIWYELLILKIPNSYSKCLEWKIIWNHLKFTDILCLCYKSL